MFPHLFYMYNRKPPGTGFAMSINYYHGVRRRQGVTAKHQTQIHSNTVFCCTDNSTDYLFQMVDDLHSNFNLCHLFPPNGELG